MRRKILLASSFVVTVLGCTHEETRTNNPPGPVPNPPAPTTVPSDTATTPTSTSKPVIMNPPPPPQPTDTPPPSDEPNVTVQKQPDGTCLRIVTAKCPPGAMCNPPPPMKVPCPAGTK
jgi:hypothetical protein